MKLYESLSLLDYQWYTAILPGSPGYPSNIDAVGQRQVCLNCVMVDSTAGVVESSTTPG